MPAVQKRMLRRFEPQQAPLCAGFVRVRGGKWGRAVKFYFGKWLDEKVRRIWLHQAPPVCVILRLGGKKGGE